MYTTEQARLPEESLTDTIRHVPKFVGTDLKNVVPWLNGYKLTTQRTTDSSFDGGCSLVVGTYCWEGALSVTWNALLQVQSLNTHFFSPNFNSELMDISMCIFISHRKDKTSSHFSGTSIIHRLCLLGQIRRLSRLEDR